MRFSRIAPTVLSLCLLPAVAFCSPTLQHGSHGHDVIILQKKLKEIGYNISYFDGIFGDETKKAVSDFQRDKKIKITGVVNSATWRLLKEIKSPVPDVLPTKKASADSLIATAKKYIGTPYALGGTTPAAFDCSGYMQFVFRAHGITLPRTADAQYLLGSAAKAKKGLVPGDLVFFDTSGGISHVGMYIGHNEFIHASSSKGVRIDALDNSYWQPRYLGGKRVI